MNINENNIALQQVITDLNTTIVSLNEGFTQDLIDLFSQGVSKLEKACENRPVIITFSKMMRSLGHYLDTKKEKAHPDSIPALLSISTGLKTIIETPEMEEAKTNRILSDEINNYKTFKNKLVSNPDIRETDINDLKTVILAIDWEISDETLHNFDRVVSQLLPKFKSYRIHYNFLKIIHSTGRYIGSRKANAHTESISFLHTVFQHFEHMLKTPGMSFKEKKELFEENLGQFNQFKNKISTQTNTSPAPKAVTDIPDEKSKGTDPLDAGAADVADDTEFLDENMPPALSHLNKANTPAPGDVVPLTEFPEEEALPATGKTDDSEESSPRSSGIDVMDDLFTVKESPADALLDEIHLMQVRGPDKGDPYSVPDGNKEVHPKGVKNFSHEQQAHDPIPEISNTLDAFFNLDAPEGPAGDVEDVEVVEVEPFIEVLDSDDESGPQEEAPLDEEAPLLEEAAPLKETDTDDGIVTFETEEEVAAEGEMVTEDEVAAEEEVAVPDEAEVASHDESEESDTNDLEITDRLLSLIQTPDWSRDEGTRESISQDLASLENRFQDNPEKLSLVHIISSLFQGEKSPAEKPKGLWGKIKGMFTSNKK